ncbi:MAG: hypothetical protein IH897_12965, partial [Planctomycetes bacterium]|nr:hypothetical protein [Planctomycetota bacterium]
MQERLEGHGARRGMAGGKVFGKMTVTDTGKVEDINQLQGHTQTLHYDYCYRLLGKEFSPKELEAILETHIRKTGALPFDVFTARREAFKDRLEKLDTGAMDALRSASIVINEFLDRGIKPGDADSGSPSAPDLVEKTAMTK